MKVLIALTVLLFAMAIGGDKVAAADASTRQARLTHIGAHRNSRVGGRPYVAYYLGRPIYYSPGPLFPWLPFIPDWQAPLDW